MTPTITQLRHRQRLVNYLAKGDIKAPFTMEVHDYDPLGHAVVLGIRIKQGETWPQFALRAFGWDSENEPDKWAFLFCAAWANVDNTPAGAALRIRQLTEDRIPQDWKQKIGLATND